jgi:hypothetical protein
MKERVRNIVGVLVCAALAALAANYGVAALLNTVLARAEARDPGGAALAQPGLARESGHDATDDDAVTGDVQNLPRRANRAPSLAFAQFSGGGQIP